MNSLFQTCGRILSRRACSRVYSTMPRGPHRTLRVFPRRPFRLSPKTWRWKRRLTGASPKEKAVVGVGATGGMIGMGWILFTPLEDGISPSPGKENGVMEQNSKKEETVASWWLKAMWPIHSLFDVLMSVGTGFVLVIRALQLIVIFLPALVTTPLLLFGDPSSQLIWYRILSTSVEYGGPCLIKLGQWASTRPDVFPWELCDEFARLTSNARPHSMADTQVVLRKSFGWEVDDVFSSFDPKPVASGAVAQVHRAVLRPQYVTKEFVRARRRRGRGWWRKDQKAPCTEEERTVAVKVMHPYVQERVFRDLKIISGVVRTICFVIPSMRWASPVEAVEQFADIMHQQLDLRTEAHHLQRFSHNFRHRFQIVFPVPVDGFVSSSVLVESFEKGVSMSSIVKTLVKHSASDPPPKVGRLTLDPIYTTTLARIGFRNFMSMVLEVRQPTKNHKKTQDNFVHSDLHPGNILVRHRQPETLMERLLRVSQQVVERWLTVPPGFDRESIERVKQETASWSGLWSGGANNGLPEMVLLDAGLVTELYPRDEQNFVDVFLALMDGDGERVAMLMLRESRVEQCDNPKAFQRDMHQIVQGVLNQKVLSNLDLGATLTEVLSIVRRHRVRIESNFTNLVMSIVILEGVGRQLDPTMKLIDEARATIITTPRLLRKVVMGRTRPDKGSLFGYTPQEGLKTRSPDDPWKKLDK